MIVQYAKDLGKLDSSLSIKINVVDNVFTMEVVSEEIGTLYSFSSTSLSEVYKKILNYKDCLEDVDKFNSLLDEISNVPLEV